MQLCELEIAKNIDVDYSIESINKLLSWLINPRYLNFSKIGTTYYYQNDSLKIPIYDKKAEIKYRLGPEKAKRVTNKLKTKNRIRVETTIKKNREIYRYTGLKTLADLWDQENYESLGDTFNTIIENRLIFPDRLNVPFTTTDHKTLSNELAALINEVGKNNAVTTFIIQQGIDQVIEKIGSLANFKQIMKEAGYSDSAIRRHALQITKIICRGMSEEEFCIAQDFINKLKGERQ